ncbi:hypothetical protein [Sphingomicrobium lutaoense]|uniref:Uncharacterized protein n=1 Tax=Sphingomicrobium lutaoense TaxID=515949 RepID=A0A839Z3B5_9SPHN|nr:hypothetical protein [Sphingomicrobium lutaoense]MBB3765038.1 hypothetical protein [Sphingomicrobium lutaoense]
MPHHDHRYFEKRAARAREAAGHKGGGRDARVAGHLALAYSALARRKKAQDELSES